MNAKEHVLTEFWLNRSSPERPYLLLNDSLAYFQDVPASVTVNNQNIAVHLCFNEWALRWHTEEERENETPTPRILVSRLSLTPDTVVDLQARASTIAAALTAIDLAQALGVRDPRPMLTKLPVSTFWSLAPFLHLMNEYSFERVILAALLNDPEVFAAGWTPERVLDKLWYEGGLGRIREVFEEIEIEERLKLEEEFFTIARHWLDDVQFTVVEVAVKEAAPPPVLPLCVLASILKNWNILDASHLCRFLEGSELGDLFLDVLRDDVQLTGLAQWGHTIARRADDCCTEALQYLEQSVFPAHPEALTEALAAVIRAVNDSRGVERLLKQLVRLLEADGGLLAQGLTVTLHHLLKVIDSDITQHLPLEQARIDLSRRLDLPDSDHWQHLLELLLRHQARERYEAHIMLLEAMITLHRLTGKAEQQVSRLNRFTWQEWLPFIDSIYLPLATCVYEAKILTERLPRPFHVARITRRAEDALDQIRQAYIPFYIDPTKGLPKWIAERHYAAGTSRPWLNSDVVEYAVKPLLADPDLECVYLIVFDGMSVTNWTMLRDRFLMVKGRELFRTYSNGLHSEQRACTYLPSATHLCRRAIFAGAPPREFNTWPHSDREHDLLTRCFGNLGIKLADWDPAQHYFLFNEKNADPDALRKQLRKLINKPVSFKAIVFNLQDRLLDKSGISSLQEIMLTYVREVALPCLRQIAQQSNTAIVFTADHGYAYYNGQYVIDDVKLRQPGKEAHTHNRYLEYYQTQRTRVGPPDVIQINNPADFGMPPGLTGVDLITGTSSYGWPRGKNSSRNPYKATGYDHGGLTPEETIVPVVMYVTKG